ncbi:MAG: DUF459 domain-containing protein, partial [Deltaproteobacteria bacterium]
MWAMVRPMNRIGTIATLFAALTLLATPARAERCPVTKGNPTVYAIGSSTLGSVLGPMLQHILKEEGVEMHRWGRASSGLARPDFHDWVTLAPGLMQKHRPDIVVVSLGTNDFQPLYNKGKWVGLESAKWEKIYAKRVDALLTRIAGKKKERLVIWMGPHAFIGERAQARGPIVNRIMRERVEAFAADGGNAVFVDAFAATLDKRGQPLAEAKLPGSKKVERIRTPDNIHLTTDAVRWLMAEPILAHVRPCLPSAEPVATKDDETEVAGDGGAPRDEAPAVEARDDTAVEAKADEDGATAQEAEAATAPSEGDEARAQSDGDDAQAA